MPRIKLKINMNLQSIIKKYENNRTVFESGIDCLNVSSNGKILVQLMPWNDNSMPGNLELITDVYFGLRML